MSRFVLLEVALKREYLQLYQYYFKEDVLLYYNEKVPYIVVGMGPNISEDAAIEFSNGCQKLKRAHQSLFDIELKSFFMTKRDFLQVEHNWEIFFNSKMKRMYQ